MDVPSLGRNENNDAEHLIKRKVLMTALRYTVKFKKTLLASLIGLSVSQYTFALQEISDAGLSEATGEGIALLPENFSMVFQGANNTASASTDYTDRSKDTGYIRYIPVGPLTTTSQDTNKDGNVTAADHSVGKADIYMYGLALSKADGDSNSRFSNTAIGSWGTATNPWLFKVATEANVPNFSAVSSADTGAGSVSYLMLEAPLYQPILDGAAGADAYKLKLGLWADAFVRDPTKIEGDAAQFHLGQLYGGVSDATRANRLRLQAIWDGFSLNGTNLKVFQTLGGATNAGGLSTSYNNTLGIAGVVRLNSADTRASSGFAANEIAGSVNRSVYITNRYSPTGTDATAAPGAAPTAYQRFRLRTLDTVDTVTTGSFTMPTNASVLRLSTQECGTGSKSGCAGTPQGVLASPGLSGSTIGAPTFDSKEGLHLYGFNANLVLGSLYQPLTLGVASDNKNLMIELARIPNKESIYQKIYTDYDNPNSTLYKGSTCNIYQCGRTIDGVFYPASHSSISIGSTNYNTTNNQLTAYKDAGAIGVSFGALENSTGTTTVNSYYQLQYQRRDRVSNTQWSYVNNQAASTFTNGTNNCATSGGNNCNEFDRGFWITAPNFALTSSPVNDIYALYTPTTSHAAYYVAGRANVGANFANGASCLAYSSSGSSGTCTNGAGAVVANIGAYNPGSFSQTVSNAGVIPVSNSGNSVAWGPLMGALVAYDNSGPGGTSIPRTWNNNTVPAIPVTPPGASPLNNLGSAAIDGLLIQHMKITTKGL